MAYPYYSQNYFQPTYTPQQVQTPVVQQTQQNNPITWVQGENAAKSYPVQPGQSILLMDSEESVFYIKSTDQSGMPQPLRIFDYTERKNEPTTNSNIVMQRDTDYVSRSEFDAFRNEITNEIRKGVRIPNVNTKKINKEE